MSTTTLDSPAVMAAHSSSRSSTILVFCCTLIGAAAQMFIKLGASHGNPHGLQEIVISVLHNFPLLFGYFLYAINVVLMVLALRKGELSVVYPIIALTYVWVTILSFFMFHESMNVFKLLGLATIVAGVSVLGKKETA